MLIDLNKQYVIVQDSGREVPLNDLDCCLISIQENKIRRVKRSKNLVNDPVFDKEHNEHKHMNENNGYHKVKLPFSDFKVNLYSSVVQNKLNETRLLTKK